MAVGLDEPQPSVVKVYDVATRTELFSFGRAGDLGANFFSFAPGATQLAVSDGRSIAIRDGATGAMVQQIPGAFGTTPDWSPDGLSMVFTEQVAGACDNTFEDDDVPICVRPSVQGSGQIATLQNVGGTWQRGPVLIPRGAGNAFYPTYSPDGQWVLYNHSAANMPSYNLENAEMPTDHRLWVVRGTGGTPVQLVAATSAVGDTWPKFDPTAYMHRGEPLFWFTFSSRRGYGLRTADGGPSQLWMAAFVPSRAGAGFDPATPPIYLPFQGVEGGNHIAQWVTRVERPACTDGSQCGAGEFCMNGQCIPNDLI